MIIKTTMAVGAARSEALSLYKLLIRESGKITSYNFRNYALRRIRDAFRENKGLADVELVQKQLNYGRKNLDIIRRQAIIGHLYATEKLVIENGNK